MVISTVSVTLVLLLTGVVALINQTARNVAESVRSNIGYVVLIDDLASPQAVDSLNRTIMQAPSTASVIRRTADDVLAQWQTQIDAEALPEVNPFLPEYEVRVKPQWANGDSLQAIATRLQGMTAVYEDVRIHADMASNVNVTVRAITMTLSIVACLILLISFVLINNTVRMEIYSQRTLIHTMQYVGATRWFIRRPYLAHAIYSGLIAAAVASAILAGALAAIRNGFPQIAQSLSWGDAIAVFILLAGVGVIVCLLAAWLATTRYLYRDADEIFD